MSQLLMEATQSLKNCCDFIQQQCYRNYETARQHQLLRIQLTGTAIMTVATTGDSMTSVVTAGRSQTEMTVVNSLLGDGTGVPQ